MKVLHVITGLDAGGAETQLAILLRHTRHDADVVTLYNPGPVAEQIRADGTSVRDIGMRGNRDVRALLKLRSLIRAGRYDVVHAHLYRSQIYARPAARLARTPVVVTTEHSIGETHIERRKMSAGVRGLYLASELFSDATIAVSDIVRDRLVKWGVPDRKITVIPNGLDAEALTFDPVARKETRERFGIPQDAYVLGTLGRLDENKRVGLTIEAAAPLLNDKCVLFVVGRGDQMEALKQAAARFGVGDRVIFAGFQADTAAMLSALDLYVAASAQETFGLAVLEAMASGMPVLYTTCPALDGISTAQARQVTGETPAALREALRAALREAVETGQGPRVPDGNVFARYGIASTARRVDDLYERLRG